MKNNAKSKEQLTGNEKVWLRNVTREAAKVAIGEGQERDMVLTSEDCAIFAVVLRKLAVRS